MYNIHTLNQISLCNCIIFIQPSSGRMYENGEDGESNKENTKQQQSSSLEIVDKENDIMQDENEDEESKSN